MTSKTKIIVLFAFISLASCSIIRNEIDYDLLYCNFTDIEPIGHAPDNANMFRSLAKQFPNTPNEFGPPPSQQLYSGEKGDTSNEYWYFSKNGNVYLFVNADDFYVYGWEFKGLENPVLVNHSLYECGCHFCESD